MFIFSDIDSIAAYQVGANVTIKYAAVHERNLWRTVSGHTTFEAATKGKDGAEALLRRIGRVGKKWDEYGAVSAVFVWREGAENALGLRLRPGDPHEIERQKIPLHQIASFKAGQGPTVGQIRCGSIHAAVINE